VPWRHHRLRGGPNGSGTTDINQVNDGCDSFKFVVLRSKPRRLFLTRLLQCAARRRLQPGGSCGHLGHHLRGRLLFGGFNLLDRTRAEPPCASDMGNFAVLNVNGDGANQRVDIVYMANFLFMGGSPPVQGLACSAWTRLGTVPTSWAASSQNRDGVARAGEGPHVAGARRPSQTRGPVTGAETC